MHHVLSKGQPHKHPPIAFLISSGRERGLPTKIQEILRLGYVGDAYDEVKARASPSGRMRTQNM